MKKLLLLLMFGSYFSSSAQEFPGDFLGEWEGELLWYKPGKVVPQKIKMQLTILPDTSGTFSWQIIYGETKADVRPYILKPVNKTLGHWQIDENNGIILDQYWNGNRFSGSFSILASTITNSYFMKNGMLHIEFYSFSKDPVNTTGGQNAETPGVQSFAMNSFQLAILSKRK